MKKLRVFKTINVELDDVKKEFKIYYDTLNFIGDYAPIALAIDDNDNVLCTIVDKKINPVIPCRVSNVNSLDIYSFVFENNRSLYYINDKTYLIDLDNVKFKDDVPINYIKKINGYYPLDSKRVVAVEDEFYLFDVSKNKRLSENFSYIDVKDNKLNWYLVFGISDSENRYLYTSGFISKSGKIDNEVLIDDIKAWYSDDELKSVKNIKELSFKNYYDIKGDNKCNSNQ